MSSVFEIRRLHYAFGKSVLLDLTGLRIKAGDIIHLSGQSGSGKSLLGLSLIGFFAQLAEVQYDFDIQTKSIDDWRKLRSTYIGYIFQQPKAYFNPIKTCGNHLMDLLDGSKSDKIARIDQWLIQFNLPEGDSFYKRYPHEFSIGELQRIYIISALIRNPKFIIADEIFSHIDWPTASLIGKVVQQYIVKNNAALLLITHEKPGTFITPTLSWQLVAGKIIEKTATDPINILKREIRSSETKANPALLELSGISKMYRNRFNAWGHEKGTAVIDNVSMQLVAGECVGLMGTSGSGKTTLAKLCCGLTRATSGAISPEQVNMFSLRSLFKRRASPIQLVHQDPFSSFNTSQLVHEQITAGNDTKSVEELCAALNLPKTVLSRSAFELSGGELQRLALIRSLVVKPRLKILILDEALSALDYHAQLAVMHLLNKKFADVGILMISHRFYRLESFCDRIYFMSEGKMVHEQKMDRIAWGEVPQDVALLAGKL